MKISWYGHSCFKIKCKDADLIIDPYSDSMGIKMPKIKAEAVLVTHDHNDHNNIDAIGGDPIVINGPGEYELKGVFIYGKRAYHDDKNGSEKGVITMYLIEDENVKIAHLGDLGQKKLTDDQLEFLDDVDILLIPIGGPYSLKSSDAINIINEIEPRVVIPMHYKIDGVNIDLEGVDKFVKEIGPTPEKLDEFKASKDSFSADELKLIILNKQ